MKVCTLCKKEKENSEFIGKKGRETKECFSCRKIKQEYRERNREKLKEKGKEYREKNREKVLLSSKRYRDNNKQKIKEYYEINKERISEVSRIRYDRNKEQIKARVRASYYEDKSRVLERIKKYRENNQEKIAKGKKEWQDKNKSSHFISNTKWQNALAKYSKFCERLIVLEKATKDINTGNLIVSCAKCGREFTPTNAQVHNRLSALESANGTENRIYCSEECKRSCAVFAKKGGAQVKIKARVRDQAWATKIKERAGNACERCGSKENLIAHHEIPVKLSGECVLEEDNGICLCKDCHKKAHSEKGCTFSDLRKI